MSVTSAAASVVAMTQARVQNAIAVKLLKIARDVGSPQQMLELVRQVADAAQRTAASAVGDGHGRLDLIA